MKQYQVLCNVLKISLLASLLIACDSDQKAIPDGIPEITKNDQNGKLAQIKLVKYGNDTLQYIKSGTFMGKIANVTTLDYSTNYSYFESHGVLSITSKCYKKVGNVLQREIVYHVSNGRCFKSQEVGSNYLYQFKYNAANLLEEVKIQNPAGPDHLLSFSYVYIAGKNAYRLDKIAYPYVGKSFVFSYTATPDKQLLNHQIIANHLAQEPVYIDEYLPIFGKFSDLLILDANTESANSWDDEPYSFFTYVFDKDGNAIVKNEKFHPEEKGSGAGVTASSKPLIYSAKWY
jgi:hypothetical protein